VTEDRQSTETPLHTLLRVMRQRALLIVLCTILVPAVAYFVSLSQEDEYQATAKLLLTPPGSEQAVLDGSVPAPPSDAGDAATSLDLVSVRGVAEQTAKALGDGTTAGEIEGSIEITAPESADSSVVDVAATAPRAARAADIANTYSEEYIDFRRTRAREQLNEAIESVEQQIQDAQGSDTDVSGLQERAEDLQLSANLQTGDAELVEEAVPPGSPSSPKPRQAAILGIGFGLLIGIGLALALEMVSRRLNDPKDVEVLYDSPILGIIPRTNHLGRSNLDPDELSMGERNAFQHIRTNLRYYNDYNVDSVLVVSSAPEEGKTTVAWNLGVAAAEAGVKAIVLEVDLRVPAIARRAGLDSDRSLGAILNGTIEIEDAIQRVPVGTGQNGRDRPTLDVITAGTAHPSPTALLESERMERVILTLEEWYDLVIIDTPPALVVSDAISLIDKAGGVIVVSRVRKDTRDAAGHLRRALDNVGAPILGIVINGVSAQEGLHGYGYGYEPRAKAGAGAGAPPDG
jgi:capsular exopolysaccharide synthesis family protein